MQQVPFCLAQTNNNLTAARGVRCVHTARKTSSSRGRFLRPYRYILEQAAAAPRMATGKVRKRAQLGQGARVLVQEDYYWQNSRRLLVHSCVCVCVELGRTHRSIAHGNEHGASSKATTSVSSSQQLYTFIHTPRTKDRYDAGFGTDNGPRLCMIGRPWASSTRLCGRVLVPHFQVNRDEKSQCGKPHG